MTTPRAKTVPGALRIDQHCALCEEVFPYNEEDPLQDGGIWHRMPLCDACHSAVQYIAHEKEYRRLLDKATARVEIKWKKIRDEKARKHLDHLRKVLGEEA